jgi:hypothetical protein
VVCGLLSQSNQPAWYKWEPSGSPTTTFSVRLRIYQAEIPSLWPLATEDGADAHLICMKWLGCPDHNQLDDPSEKPSESLATTFSFRPKRISGWGYIFMTTSHSRSRSRRCQNPCYMYEVDLLWVWSVWCVGCCLNQTNQHGTSEKPRESPTTTFFLRPNGYQAGVAYLWPLARVEGAETHVICMK